MVKYSFYIKIKPTKILTYSLYTLILAQIFVLGIFLLEKNNFSIIINILLIITTFSISFKIDLRISLNEERSLIYNKNQNKIKKNIEEWKNLYKHPLIVRTFDILDDENEEANLENESEMIFLS